MFYHNLIKIRSAHLLLDPFYLFYFWLRSGRSKDIPSEFTSDRGQIYDSQSAICLTGSMICLALRFDKAPKRSEGK